MTSSADEKNARRNASSPASAAAFHLTGTPHPDWARRVDKLAELGFTWANLGEEPYWLDQIAVLERAVYEELLTAGSSLWHIFDRTVRYLHRNRSLYELMGIPSILWEMVDREELPPPGLISRYARFDFAISNDGVIKLLELNADTPTGYVEAAIATPWLCAEAGIDSPNEQMQELIAAAWAEEQPDTVACIAYGAHAEDSGTIEALLRHSGLTDAVCRDCLELYVDNGLLKDASGRVIRRLFALYPKEWMAVDEGGDALAYAIENEELKLFNAPAAILLQTKGLLAVVWGLYELGQLYTEAERETIARYMLPTYNKPVFDGSYVSKSMFGREGGSVRLFDEGGRLELEDRDGYDTSRLFPVVYQKRAALARLPLARPSLTLSGGKGMADEDTVGEGAPGNRRREELNADQQEPGEQSEQLHLLTGLFVLNGQPCGLLGRAGGPITGNTSHFIPIGVN